MKIKSYWNNPAIRKDTNAYFIIFSFATYMLIGLKVLMSDHVDNFSLLRLLGVSTFILPCLYLAGFYAAIKNINK